MKFSSGSPSLRSAFAAAAAIACLVSISAQSLRAQRLPTTVLPQHYTLTLTPDLKAATFTGDESIDVTLNEPASTITLNAAEIAFQSVTITAAGKEQTATVSLDDDKQQATFTFPDTLSRRQGHTLPSTTPASSTTSCAASISPRPPSATTPSRSSNPPTRAAPFLPSTSRPSRPPTTFRWSSTPATPPSPTAPSSPTRPAPAPASTRSSSSPRPKCPPISSPSWSATFNAPRGESDGVAIRACATPDKVALTPYALEVAKYVLHYYNTYFGIPYPLKKLDLIALPDFEAGAMENFGAITYRETDLLIDPKTASVGAKREVALVDRA